MSSMRWAVLPTPRNASARNAGSSKCTGRFFNIRFSEVAAFLRSCTKNADIVAERVQFLGLRDILGKPKVQSTDVT